MNKISFIKIKTLTLTGFRCFADKTVIQMDDITCISGSNGLGKTSIAHAIAFVFYGITFFGEQAIDRLRNKNTGTVEVTVQFEDQNGAAHSLMRNRHKDRTIIAFDTFTVRQSDIDRLFSEKNIFLSMFNPLYFIERIGEEGRELLQKLLPSISPAEVIKQLSEYDQSILKGKESLNPEGMVKRCREEINQHEDSLCFLEGQLDLLQQQAATKDIDLVKCRNGLEKARESETVLAAKQFDGIDIEDLSIQICALQNSLAADSDQNSEIIILQSEIKTLQQKQYVSPYTANLAELTADISTLSAKYKEIDSRIKSLKIGDKCPTCLVQITPRNIAQVKSELQNELQGITVKGKNLTAQKNDLLELDKKSRATFEQFRADDIKKAESKLTDLQKNSVGTDKRRILDEIRVAEEKIRFGNLSETELSELNSYRAEIVGYESALKGITDQNPAKGMEKVQTEMKALEESIKQNKHLLCAVHSFAGKRAEMTLSGLELPHVEFKLFEVIKSTGEVKDVFHFTYNKIDYRTLSLSEKVKAGLEVSALLRRLTNLEYPVFIDNTESIANLDRSVLPSQTILTKVEKGKAFTVAANSNRPPMKKAG